MKSGCHIGESMVSELVYDTFSKSGFPVLMEEPEQPKHWTENNLVFQTIFANDSIGIVVVDLDGRMLEINPAFLKMLGFRKEELLNHNFNTLFHPDDLQLGNSFYVDMILSDRDHYQIERRFAGKDGLLVWGRLTIMRVKSSSVESNVLVAMIEDISKRKQMEEVLIAEKKRLAITLCSIADAVIATDIDGNIILINQVAEKLTGWGQEEAIGEPSAKVFHIKDDKTGDSYENPVNNVLQSGKVLISENILLVSRDGVERHVSFSIAPIRNSMGDYSGTILVFRDITEKRKMEEELIKGQKYESMAVLAGGVGHDFNNILAGILANVQLAEVLYAKGKDISKNFSKIIEAVKRAANLTRQLLTFAKGGVMVKKTTTIADLVKSTADFALCGSNVKCEYLFSDDIWPVEADEGQLSQVINNLIINAFQAMPNGGVIYISGRNIELGNETSVPLPEGKYVKIEFRDTGEGIPEEYLSRIFDPYFTTKEKGSGLGLATSYSIIKKHGGYIGVESPPQEGATFYIYLPSPVSKAEEEISQPEKIYNGKGRILLMDDEETIRNTTPKILAHLGYKTAVAKDGAELLELYTKAQQSGDSFDAVIMDLTVPGGLGGKETIGKLMKIDPGVKAVLSSGYSDDRILLNYRRYGFKGVVIKPYKMEELSATLHQIIAR